MSDETPSIDELKEQEKYEIPVEEDEMPDKESVRAGQDISEALGNLGRQIADTFRAAWNSQERHEIEVEVREGMKHFSAEVQKAYQEARESPAAKKVQEEADEVRTRVEKGELAGKARQGLVDGLTWLSEEMRRLAEQFTPPEKEPEEVVEPEESSEA